jgi:hypothetical protein
MGSMLAAVVQVVKRVLMGPAVFRACQVVLEKFAGMMVVADLAVLVVPGTRVRLVAVWRLVVVWEVLVRLQQIVVGTLLLQVMWHVKMEYAPVVELRQCVVKIVYRLSPVMKIAVSVAFLVVQVAVMLVTAIQAVVRIVNNATVLE